MNKKTLIIIGCSFIGFIVEPDDNKYFILDYQY